MSKKTIIKKWSYLLLLVLFSVSLMVPVSAATKKGTHNYSCRQHKSCMYVRLACDYTGKKINSTWWDGSYMHWPNGVKFGSRGSGTGYARGTYTAYSSLITQWASIAFQSYTDTIYIYV